jgi:ubiquinone/menaquinone biosynthesis C-methylase UbiE
MNAEQLANEAEYADKQYAIFEKQLDINPRIFRHYSEPRHKIYWREMGALLLGDVRGCRLLDLGCGMGEESVYWAKLGAEVHGVEISEKGLQLGRKRAAHNGVNVRFYKMLGQQTGFPDASFDVIHGMGILHHVGLDLCIREVHRLLKPGGRAVFLEPMGNSAFVDKMKGLIFGDAERGTDYEAPLRWDDVAAVRPMFSQLEMYPYHLLARLAAGEVRLRRSRVVLWFDYMMLRAIPALRHFAGGMVIFVRK